MIASERAKIRQPRHAEGRGVALILLAALMAVVPELVRGNSCGHDFDFHLVSWLDALNAWRHGIMYPHWTPSANFGAGEPRFVFYSPLTWMLGAALGAVLPWAWVPAALTFLLLAGTGLATRSLARDALGEAQATLAGCVALFSGYALFTAYERTAFAELAGGLWIPLVLKYALRDRGAAHESNAGCAVLLAIAVAGAWLSNPTVGVMACYTLAAVALLAAGIARSWRPVARAAAGAVVGLALVAFYLVPAAWEQRWVDIHQVTEDPGQTLENNWLFAVHADPSLALHDQVLRTASIIAVAMVAVALLALVICLLRRRLPGPARWWAPLALIPFAVLLLQFPFSRPLWNLLPDLRFLQFPWRWLLVLEPAMAVFVAAAVWPAKSARPWQRIAVSSAFAAVFLALTAYAAQSFYQPCDDEDAVPGMMQAYRAGQGFIGTFEYEPVGADIALIPTGLPEACLVSNSATVLGKPSDEDAPVWNAAVCAATYSAAANSGPEHVRIAGIAGRPGFLILRLRAYPAWRIAVNGRAPASLPQRADGLIAVPVVAGSFTVTADWTTTRDIVFARWISIAGVLALTGLCFLHLRRARSRLS